MSSLYWEVSRKSRTHLQPSEIRATRPNEGRFIGQVHDLLDFHQRTIGMWLIDFDQCTDFPEDVQGLKQLEGSFYFNDPYYPRPASTDLRDKVLRETFKTAYLRVSAGLTASEMP